MSSKLMNNDTLVDENGNYSRNLALLSHKSSGVPGTVDGLIKIFDDYGSGNFTLDEILSYAIEYAEKLSKENKRLSKYIGKSSDKLKIDLGNPDEDFKNEKGIIHCHTYKNANYLKKNIRSKRILVHNSENREIEKIVID